MSHPHTWQVDGGKPTFELQSRSGQHLTPGWHLATTDLTATDKTSSATNSSTTTGTDTQPLVTLRFLDSSGDAWISHRNIPSVRQRRVSVVHVPTGTGTVHLEVSSWVDTVSVSHVTLKPLPSAVAVSLMAADLAASSATGSTNRSALVKRLDTARRERGNRATVEEVAFAYHELQKQRAGASVDYEPWRQHYATLNVDDERSLNERCDALGDDAPTISVVMAIYNPSVRWLTDAINSVIDQTYSRWQLVLVNDASTDPAIATTIDRFAAQDDRIVVHHRSENGHIAAATRDGIDRATGDFVAFMDHDDELAPFALALIALESSSHDILYTDEDKIGVDGRHYEPHFKPSWNRELLLGQNYMSHLTAIRSTLIEEVGGLRLGFDGSQDHDLLLRATAAITPDRICHIPFAAYHWRAIDGSTALDQGEKDYTQDASVRALSDHLGDEWTVEPADSPTTYRCTPPLTSTPLVSIIIPTRDRLNLVTQCIDSLTKTTYPNYEVLIVDNDSEESETLEWFAEFDNGTDRRVISAPGPFNFSAINNLGVRESNGELLMLLNNDTEVIDPDWLTEMVRWILQDGVGVVGAKLLYPNDTIQHAGVVLGFGGFAAHSHVHEAATAPGYFDRLTVAHEAGAVTGACLLTTRETWDQLGGLEEDLAVAFNDIDYCLRVRHEAGQRVIWTPHGLLYHHESVSRGREDDPVKAKRFAGEVELVKQRWADLLDDDPAYSPNLALEGYTFELSHHARVDPPWKN